MKAWEGLRAARSVAGEAVQRVGQGLRSRTMRVRGGYGYQRVERMRPGIERSVAGAIWIRVPRNEKDMAATNPSNRSDLLARLEVKRGQTEQLHMP